MELGNFLGKLKGENKSEPKKFLALVLTDEVVQSSVWNINNEQTEIVSIGSPVEWDGDTGTTGELITAVDATISSATEGMEEEPNSVILGIPNSWTGKDGILGVKRDFINKIRKELELEALGYVPITESIISYLKLQEGTPTTSILIQVSRDELTISLVRLGRIEANEVIGRSDDVVEDVTEGIARFKIMDNLPSRIILFNSMHNLDDIIQNLLSIDWPKEFNFLHIPKIEALPKDVTIRALSVAGGAEVAKSLGFTLLEPSRKNVVVEPDSQDFSKPEELESVESDEDSTFSGSVEQEGDHEETSELENIVQVSSDDLLTAEEIGFAVDPVVMDDNVVEETNQVVDEELSEEIVSEPVIKIAPRKPLKLPSFSLPKISLPHLRFSFKGTSSKLWYLVGGVVAVVALIVYFIWFLPSASIVVRVIPRTLEQDVNLTLSTTESSINFDDRIVPASVETVTESGEKIIETTGKKTIGDPSKGEVTIFNRTTATKSFPKGTTISASSLKFTLDQDVTVASKSAGSDYVDVPGKATVAISASAIGKDGNLASGTEFTIQSFGKDSYVAKNDNALSGGTSEEVQVVGKDDQKNLAKDLTAELLTTLTTKAQGSSTVGTGVYLIPDSAKVDSSTYSVKTGDTAKNLTGSITLKATLLRYQTDNVTTLVNSAIDQAVPPGFVRANLPSTVDLSASSVGEGGSTVQGKAKVQVSLLPVVDKNNLKSLIKGKKISSLESILPASVPGYQTAEVSFTPRWFPTKLKSIPLNSGSINLNILPSL